jgi:hypothetical protein
MLYFRRSHDGAERYAVPRSVRALIRKQGDLTAQAAIAALMRGAVPLPTTTASAAF